MTDSWYLIIITAFVDSDRCKTFLMRKMRQNFLLFTAKPLRNSYVWDFWEDYFLYLNEFFVGGAKSFWYRKCKNVFQYKVLVQSISVNLGLWHIRNSAVPGLEGLVVLAGSFSVRIGILHLFSLSPTAKVGPNTQLTNGCVIGNACRVNSVETLQENTVVYGESCTRRKMLEKPPVRLVYINLRKLI